MNPSLQLMDMIKVIFDGGVQMNFKELEHKPGCIQVRLHRVPIDCCTVAMLWDEIERLKQDVKERDRKLKKMALEIYGLRETSG